MKSFILFGLILVVISSLFIGCSCSKSMDSMSVDELLDLGGKYLLEMDYAQAMVCFNKAIEIDPRNEQAYIALADTYLGMGELAAASEALERALVYFPGGEIEQKLEELSANAATSSFDEADTIQAASEEPVTTPDAFERFQQQDENRDVDYAQIFSDYLQREVIAQYGQADPEAIRGV